MVPASLAQSGPAARITRAIDASQTIALSGNVHPLARAQYDQGQVSGGTVLPRMTIFFRPTASQQTALDTLLDQQQDRTSPNYHQWLTPEEYGQQFGMSAADLAKVTAWLQAQGFTLVETARSQNFVVFSGTAAQVASALHTQIHRYTVNGESHYANATEPFVPAALADVVQGFRGLNDFRPHPRVSVQPKFTSGLTGNHFVTPGDFATIYDVNSLYSAGIDGTGQKIAVMGQTDITLSDIAAFRSAAGLTARAPQVITIGTEPNVSTPDILEADLDVEWAGAVAKNATVIYVTASTANGVFDSMQYAVSNDVAPVISISYGNCESLFGGAAALNSVNALAQQANAEGITIVGPAGDSGATDCDDNAPATQGLAVDFPASSPYVTGVGGTEFNEGAGTYWKASTNGQDIVSSALSYIPETVWNQSSASGPLLATGGGASTFFTKPTWQAGAGVPPDGMRDVPDVAFNASPSPDGYLICSSSSQGPGPCTSGFRSTSTNVNEIGGTSAGVPTFAGVVALINQETKATGQGNVNYVLYPLAAADTSGIIFHDITSGSNKIACASGSTGCPSGTATIGFAAGPGYDQATGLGSIDVNNLVSAWTSVSSSLLSGPGSGTDSANADFQIALSPASLVVAQGSMQSSTIKVVALNGFSSTPSYSCSVGTGFTGVTCAVVQSNGNFTVQVSASGTATSKLPAPPKVPSFPMLPLGVVVLAIVAAGIAALRETARLAPRLAASFILGSLLLIAAGCGGGGTNSSSNSSSGNGTASNAGTVTVTGTSGSISHTAQLTVTVN